MSRPRPNLTGDPADYEPPHHEPPSKRDYAQLWIEITRRRLRGELPELDPQPDSGGDGQERLPLPDAASG